MSEEKLISANALEQDLISKGFYPAIVKRAIEKAPTIEAEPVRHGRWKHKRSIYNEYLYICDGEEGCGKQVSIYGNKTAYCPNCGAQMDGGET